MTSRIARYADRIINLPADPFQGWVILEKLQLDIILFPDWQPFPDTPSIFFQSTRIAPIQVHTISFIYLFTYFIVLSIFSDLILYFSS